MKSTVLLRIVAGFLLLFAFGHTFGFLSFRPASAEGMAVWTAMNSVRFSQGHQSFSYGEFYTGFGLSITVTQLFMAWLAWHMAGMARRGEAGWRPIAWALCLPQIAGLILSLKYFAAPPAVLSLVVLALLVWAALSGRRASEAMHRLKSEPEPVPSK